MVAAGFDASVGASIWLADDEPWWWRAFDSVRSKVDVV